MMSTLQITSCQPCNYFRNTSQSLLLSSKPKLIQQKYMAVLKKKQCRVVSKCHQSAAPVCLLGGKGKNESDGGDEVRDLSASPSAGFLLEGLEKAMGNLKKDGSIVDVLRQQIEKNEFYEERGSGGGGSGRGNGSSGDGVDGSGGSEDEGLAGIIDETLKVILATFGFIFLYFYIISGEEWTRLAKDYLKFVFSGSKSIRLNRAMYIWGRLYKHLTEKEEYDKFWLEKAIITTPTWWDSPEKYHHIVRSNLASDSDE